MTDLIFIVVYIVLAVLIAPAITSLYFVLNPAESAVTDIISAEPVDADYNQIDT